MQSVKNLPTVEYRKVLYTTDLSEAGRFAFPYAASIASRYGAQLTVFHVVESREFEKYLVGYMNEDLWAEIKTRDLEEAKRILINRKRNDTAIKSSVDQFCQETLSQQEEKPTVIYDIRVQIGDPVEKILEEVQQGGYDLVVMGKHGHGGLKVAVTGDTARRVIRRCKVPVMVVQLPG